MADETSNNHQVPFDTNEEVARREIERAKCPVNGKHPHQPRSWKEAEKHSGFKKCSSFVRQGR